MKNGKDKKSNPKIRNYRRLRRKAKQLKRKRRIRKFVLNRVIPFTALQFFLKKIQFSSISAIIFFLGLVFNLLNDISTKQFTKVRGYEIELQQIKQKLNKSRSLIDQQQSLITDFQKEIFNWSKKYNQLAEDKEQKLKKII